MDEKQMNLEKIKQAGMKEDKFLPEFVNKIVVCELLGGKTITGVLTGYDKYSLMLVEAKDLKSKKPVQNMVYKHAIISIREAE